MNLVKINRVNAKLAQAVIRALKNIPPPPVISLGCDKDPVYRNESDDSITFGPGAVLTGSVRRENGLSAAPHWSRPAIRLL